MTEQAVIAHEHVLEHDAATNTYRCACGRLVTSSPTLSPLLGRFVGNYVEVTRSDSVIGIAPADEESEALAKATFGS